MTEPGTRVVLITGAAEGIGRATGRAFAEAGYRVVGWDIQGDPGELIAELSPGSRFEHVDVGDSQAVQAAAARLRAEIGRLDALVANAGIVRDSQLIKWRGGQAVGGMSEEDFDRVIGVNLRGVFVTVKANLPLLIASGGGSIGVASSVVAASGNFGQTNYAATKAGVIAMVRTWSRELGRFRIRVNAVAPGFIETPMVRALPPQLVERVVEHTPLGRLGRAEEVAAAYLWLASDAASFVSGTVLGVDGGLVIGS